MTKRYVTNRELKVTFKGVDIVIPAGHTVDRRDGGTDAKGTNPAVWYYAGEPSKLLDAKTQGITLHDATYYGIPIPADAVTEITWG
jgi:hypothetical protein